jgi:hypothetical protein
MLGDAWFEHIDELLTLLVGNRQLRARNLMNARRCIFSFIKLVTGWKTMNSVTLLHSVARNTTMRTYRSIFSNMKRFVTSKTI